MADARDVALAMVRMAERGAIGERYIVSGPLVSMANLLAVLGEVSGIPAPRLRIPYGLAVCAAAAMDAWARLTAGKSSLPLEGVRTLRHPVPLSSAKAERELGVVVRPLRETLADTVAWFEAARAGRSSALARMEA